MVQILENRGLISDTGDERPKRYVILEELVEYLTEEPTFRDQTGPVHCKEVLTQAAEPFTTEPNLESLIQGKEYVGVPTAARYLKLSPTHVRQLGRLGKLVRLGEGRPIKISTKSLRGYKGT